MSVVLHDVDERYCFASFRNLGLLIWNTTPGIAEFNRVDDRMRALFREHPEGAGMLVISRQRVAPQGKLARESVAQLQRWGGSLVALATVVEENGALSHRITTFVKSIIVLASPKSACKPKLCRTADEAARYLAQAMKLDADEVVQAVNSLREQYPLPPNACARWS